MGGRLSKLNDHLMARLKQRRPQDSVASWAFRFAGTFPDVLTVLSGMTYMEHLQDNLRTFSPLDPCTEEEMALLEDTAQMMLTYPTVPCNDCKYRSFARQVIVADATNATRIVRRALIFPKSYRK